MGDRHLRRDSVTRERPALFLRYTTLALRRRLARRVNEGTRLGMALEGLTAADLAGRTPAAQRHAADPVSEERV